MSRKKTQKFDKLNLELKSIEAKNDKQKKVLSCEKDMLLIGSAGTGKTFLASWIAFHGLRQKLYDRVIFYRSAVSTRDIGFLPGNEKEKMSVYEEPYRDICSELFQNGSCYDQLKNVGMVSFEPTSFVRGRTLRNSFVIVDECQNMTLHELDSLITRLDDDSRIIFCGDIEQADLYKNGLASFFGIIKSMREFDTFNFSIDDVVRGERVKSYLRAKSNYFKG